jgi:cell division protein FtsL
VVWTRHESRVLFVQLTSLQNQRDDLNVEYGRLELEQATWAEPRRIDEEARAKLGMVTPAPAGIQLVRR